MIEVTVSDGTVVAVDFEKNEVSFRVRGWEPTDDGPPIDRRVDAQLSGSTAGLSFPDAVVSIESDAARAWTVVDDRTGPFELPAGYHRFRIGTSVDVYLVVTDACRVRREFAGTCHVDFEAASVVTIGFRSRVDAPRETITVPRTLEGAATAIAHQAAAIETDAPDKSYPTKRYHPPLIAFGGAVEVPEAVVRDTRHSDITVRIPRSLDALLVSAPLVYYLQARVDLSDAAAVHLEASALDDPIVLGRDASLELDVSGLLQHVFFLDCVVRNTGPYGVDLREGALLDELDIDADAAYDQSGGDRLATYRQANPSTVASWWPKWHLSFVVEPALSNVQAIPYLLDRLSLVQLPRPVPVGRQTALTESVRRSYRLRSARSGAAPELDMVRNETRLGERVGWLTDGIPFDAFRASLDAFENRFRFHRYNDGPRSVVVVINDDAMGDERAGVESIYEARAEELSIEIDVEEALTRAELADVLTGRVDFLHYIGHCDPDGLRCADGTLSAAEIEASGVQTFFLNACGSYQEGLELVRRGSVAGAVTMHAVLNPEATRVGLTFARLIMHGFSVNYALELASRQSLANRFYGVVGDGTHRLSQGEDTYPADLAAERVAPDAFEVRFNFPQSTIPGGLAKPAFSSETVYVLRGRPYTAVLDREEFVDYLELVSVPVVYENAFHWSSELADRLAQNAPSRRPGRSARLNHGNTNNN